MSGNTTIHFNFVAPDLSLFFYKRSISAIKSGIQTLKGQKSSPIPKKYSPMGGSGGKGHWVLADGDTVLFYRTASTRWRSQEVFFFIKVSFNFPAPTETTFIFLATFSGSHLHSSDDGQRASGDE